MVSSKTRHAVWLVLAVGAAAFAAGGPPDGHGGGKGGGETTLTNNLSVPMIMLGGGSFTGVTCGAEGAWTDLAEPTGVPHDGYELAGYYYVQGVNKWQAPCSNYTATFLGGSLFPVNGAWGDNLVGDASLKVGSPIRVELVLTDASTSAQTYEGYTVVKLEPSKLDRESAYGTLASGETPNFSATAELMTAGVYDAEARLEIKNVNGTVVVADGPVSAEINATGKVVYGYNLRVPSAGSYLITFTVPNVTFNACDVPNSCAGSTAVLQITVAGGGGSKGGGKP